MLDYKSVDDMRKHLMNYEYESDSLKIIEEELDVLWKELDKRDLFLKFNKKTGHGAYCMLRNSYVLVGDTVHLMKLYEGHHGGDAYFKSQGITKEQMSLLVCMVYNAFVEKIADFFKIILDIPSLCGRNKFYGSPEIIEKIVGLMPKAKMFRHVNRKIRNALAHYDFNIVGKSFIYNTEKKYEHTASHITVDFDLIIQGSLSLNRLIVVLFKRIEKMLDPYLDQNRLSHELHEFSDSTEKIRKSQANMDRL